MNRNPRKVVTEIESPINYGKMELSQDDCFGRLWNPVSEDCNICADYNICANVLHRISNVKTVNKAKLEDSHFADEYNFSRIYDTGLIDKLKNNSGAYRYTELVEVIKRLANCTDDMIIKTFTDSFILENNFKITDGIIYYGE